MAAAAAAVQRRYILNKPETSSAYLKSVYVPIYSRYMGCRYAWEYMGASPSSTLRHLSSGASVGTRAGTGQRTLVFYSVYTKTRKRKEGKGRAGAEGWPSMQSYIVVYPEIRWEGLRKRHKMR